jgi:hypothetical protein
VAGYIQLHNPEINVDFVKSLLRPLLAVYAASASLGMTECLTALYAEPAIMQKKESTW